MEHYMRERDQQFRLRTAMRRDYGIDEESFPQQYPVEEQANNIDDTPVHSTGMERQCGKVDYRGSVVRWTIGIERPCGKVDYRQCGKVDYIGMERQCGKVDYI